MTADERADLAIHQAQQEAKAAVDTFKAKLGCELRAQLADVPESLEGWTFATLEEEVFMTRLFSIAQIIRSNQILI